MGDFRLKNDVDAYNIKCQLAAALMAKGVLYAGEYKGDLVTILGFERSATEIVPIAIVFEESEWTDIPQMNDKYKALRDE